MTPQSEPSSDSATTSPRTDLRTHAIVIMPAFNEVATVATVVKAVRASGLPVLVVDDGSTDDTATAARSAGATVLQLPFNLGVGGALRCGFRWAVANGYNTAVQCDADGQHESTELHRLIGTAVERDLHLLVGSRFGAADGFKATWIRRIPMRLLSRIATGAAKTPMTDASSGFRVVREPLLSEFARSYPMHYLGDTFEVLVQAGKQGYRISEISVLMHERAGGTPSAGTVASIRFLVRSILALTIGSGQSYRKFRALSEKIAPAERTV
jgi:glycosyltransferase involved in cell wall biosynthesis